jgi:hypothetical protein
MLAHLGQRRYRFGLLSLVIVADELMENSGAVLREVTDFLELSTPLQ